MQGIEPALVLGARLPQAYNIVAVFKKFHFDAQRIAGSTSETIIAIQVDERVDYFLHIL